MSNPSLDGGLVAIIAASAVCLSSTMIVYWRRSKHINHAKFNIVDITNFGILSWLFSAAHKLYKDSTMTNAVYIARIAFIITLLSMIISFLDHGR